MNNKRRVGSNNSTAVKITVGGKEVIPERRRNINIIDHSSTSSTICGRDHDDDDNNVNGHCATNNNNNNKKIILSLHNEQYKSIMWKYFNVLGKTKTTTMQNITNEEREREEVIGKEILALFKQRQNDRDVSNNNISSSVITTTTITKFYKQRYKNGALEEVNENVALESKLRSFAYIT